MATDVEALMLRIEASSTKLEKDMKKAGSIFDRYARDLEKRQEKLNGKLNVAGRFAETGETLKQVGQFLAAKYSYDSLREVVKYFGDISDAAKKVGVSAEDLQAFGFAAQQSGGSAEEFTAGMIRFSKELGESGEKTSKLSALFKENGLSLTDASGRLRPYLDLLQDYAELVDRAANDSDAAAIAAIGFGKAGAGMVPTLREIAGGIDGIRQKAAEAGVVLSNDMVQKADELDDKWNAASARMKKNFAEIILMEYGLADALELWKSGLTNTVEIVKEIYGWWSKVGPIVDAGRFPNDYDPRVAKEGRLDRASTFYTPDEMSARDRLAKQLTAGKTTPDLTGWDNVKKARTKVPVTADKGGDTLDEYEREVRGIQEKTKALEVEIQTVGKSTEEQAKATEVQKLKTAADRAEVELTPERLAQIDMIATAYAKQVEALEKVKKAHDDATKAGEHMGEAAVDALSDMIFEGRNAGEVMQNLAKSMAKAALQSLLLGSGPFGSVFGGGIFKSFFQGAFGGGTSSGPLKIAPFADGGVVSRPTLSLSGEAGPEAFVPLQRGAIPVRLAMPSMRDMARSSSSAVSVSFAPVVDARGASLEAVARLERGLKDLAASIPSQVAAVQRRRDVRGLGVS